MRPGAHGGYLQGTRGVPGPHSHRCLGGDQHLLHSEQLVVARRGMTRYPCRPDAQAIHRGSDTLSPW